MSRVQQARVYRKRSGLARRPRPAEDDLGATQQTSAPPWFKGQGTPLSVETVLAYQRLAGNTAVQRLLTAGSAKTLEVQRDWFGDDEVDDGSSATASTEWAATPENGSAPTAAGAAEWQGGQANAESTDAGSDGEPAHEDSVWGAVAGAAGTAWGAVTETASSAVDDASEASASAWDAVSETASSAWGQVAETASAAWDVAEGAVTAVWESIEGGASGPDAASDQVAKVPGMPWPSKLHPTTHHVKGNGVTQDWLLAQGYHWVGTDEFKKAPPHFEEHWIHPETGDEVFRYISASNNDDESADDEPDAGQTARDAVRSMRGWIDLVEAGLDELEALAETVAASLGTPDYEQQWRGFQSKRSSTGAMAIGLALRLKQWTTDVGDDASAKADLAKEVQRMTALLQEFTEASATWDSMLPRPEGVPPEVEQPEEPAEP